MKIENVRFSNNSLKHLGKFSKTEASKIIKGIKLLKTNPFFCNLKKIQGIKGNIWRMRIGQIRILFEFENSYNINILSIKYRKDIYKNI